MALNNVAGFRDIHEYVHRKLDTYNSEEKTCETLFRFMFSEGENVMAEVSEGYRIKKITYGACKEQILRLAPALSAALQNAQKGDMVGLYMANSVEWIQTFWAILACGYKPLLLNSRASDTVLEDILRRYAVPAVVSDGKTFSVPTVYIQDVLQTASEENSPFQPVWADEVVFMSSGTSENVKLCVYTGERLYYQVCDTARIIKTCPQMMKGYQGELKQLALLPFYHVFGFIAVYIWFGFLARTFVFLKDIRPQTILNTVKRHKVTHIFAVPLVWDTIHKEALRKIRLRGEKTYQKFCKTLRFVNRHEGLGTAVAKSAFKEIRESLFGESIRFLISGGSMIRPETLAFFNGLGYYIANGYGMTEAGITSLELSKKRKIRNTASIGAPFGFTQYDVNDTGELLIKSKTLAAKILQNGECVTLDFETWFPSHDLVKKVGERYYIEGRQDDLIVCENGENLNPTLLEQSLKIEGADGVCLFVDKDNSPTLLLCATSCYSPKKLQSLQRLATDALKQAKLQDEIKRIAITSDPLLESLEFKISRKKIAKRYNEGNFRLLDVDRLRENLDEALSQLEQDVCACFAKALQKAPDEIGVDEDFFLSLGGTSLDYFVLIEHVKTTFNADLPVSEGKTMTTVREVCEYLKTH